MTKLILGGRGFIGSHIADSLLARGEEVRVFARSPAPDNCPTGWVTGDFRDVDKLSEALYGVDVVIHSISSTVPATSEVDPAFDIQSNLLTTIELMQLMQAHGVKRLIFLSSGGTVYGNPRDNPVTETSPLEPISAHGATKVAIEKFIGVGARAWDISPTILRPSNPYGERQRFDGVQGFISTALHNVILKKATTIYGDGSTVRDYIYVTDLADLVAKAATSDAQGVFNVGSNVGHSINEVVDVIGQACGVTPELEHLPSRPFDVHRIVLDTSKARAAFGWQPSVGLAEGIARQYEWMKQQMS